MPRILPPVFVLTDPERLPARCVPELALPRGWGVIYRHFGAEDRLVTARSLVATARQRGWIVLIANDPDLAAKTGAHGVHWPERVAQRAKRWQGRFDIMTMSWHGHRPLTRPPVGIDAALLSAVFPSRSPSAGRAMGAIKARVRASAARLPLYGLGGINDRNAAQVADIMGLACVEGAEPFHGLKL